MAEFGESCSTSKRTQDELREVMSGGYDARRKQMDGFVQFLLQATGSPVYNFGSPFSLDVVSGIHNSNKLGRVSVINRVTAYDVFGVSLVRAQLGSTPTEEIRAQELRQPTLLPGKRSMGPFEILLGEPKVFAVGSLSELSEPFTDVDVDIATNSLLGLATGLGSLADAARNPRLNPQMAALLSDNSRRYSGLQTRS